jgi:hypothetical protein
MLEIFLVQLLAAALGAASTGLADSLYRRSRIRQPVHTFWVSASISVICIPVLGWVCDVFLGRGLLSQFAAGLFISTLYLWVYRNLQKVPSPQKLGALTPSVAPFERPRSSGI